MSPANIGRDFSDFTKGTEAVMMFWYHGCKFKLFNPRTFHKMLKNWWSIKPQTLAFILNLPYVLLTSMTSNSVKGFLVLSKIYQQFLPEKICVESTKLEFSGRDAWCQNDPSVFWRNFALESAYLGWSLPPSGKAFCLFNVAGRWYAPSKKDCLVFGHKFEEKSLIKLSKKTCSLRWIW